MNPKSIPNTPPLLILSIFSLLFLICTVRSESDFSDGGDLCAGFSKPGLCPINCFRPDPVCGANGVTYWCGCPDAACAGIQVVKTGPCEVGNGGSGPVSGQALLLVHIVWLIVLGFSVLFGML